jgi:hypothetical protein
MRDMDAAAAQLSDQATADDIAAAHEFLRVREREGSAAARVSPAAVHLVRAFDLRRCVGIVARRIAADHPRPELPHQARYRQAREGLLARWRAGELSDTALSDRLDRIKARRDERDAAWRRADALEARARYRNLTHQDKVRARLAFRAARPRRPRFPAADPWPTTRSPKEEIRHA